MSALNTLNINTNTPNNPTSNHPPHENAQKYKLIHHILPHPHHKTRAKLLSHKAIFTYSLLTLLIIGIFKFVPKVAPGVLGYASDITIRELFELTSAEREKRDLPPLKLNEELSNAAQEKALDMFENNYWAHISPTGIEPWTFILAENYDYAYAGENLAKNFNNSREVVEAWMHSPSHKDNLLSQNYDEIGFAVVNGVLEGYETTLVVQFFGRPRDPLAVNSPEESNRLLESYATAAPVRVQSIKEVRGQIQPSPFIDISFATKSIAFTFATFLLLLLILDIWYSKRKAIPKFTGHTLAHIIFLVISILGVLIGLLPGKII